MMLLIAFTGGVIITVMAATNYDANTIFNTIKSNASGKTPIEQAAAYTLARIHIGLLMRELPIVDARLVAELAALPGTNTAIVDTIVANIGNADTPSTANTTGTNTATNTTTTNTTASTNTTATGTNTTSGCIGNGKTFDFTNASNTKKCVGVMPATGTRGGSKTVNATQGSGSAILTCRLDGWTLESGDCRVDKTPIAPAPIPNIVLQVVNLAAGSLGYDPVKVGTTLTVIYRANSMIQCQGSQTTPGTNLGSDIQFAYTSRDGDTGMSNTTNQPKGTFSVKINSPTTLKFTCIGIDKKTYVETIDLKVKDHNDTDTYIDVDKVTIMSAGESVKVSWQASSDKYYPTTFCHLAKTHSVNGIKGNPTVFLEPTIDLSRQNSGINTDIITAPGQYVYTLLCNNTKAELSPDANNGSMLTSRAVIYASSTTTTTATIAPTTTTVQSSRDSMGMDESFTLTLGGNNSPTRYEYNINDGATFQSYASSTFTATPRSVGFVAGLTYKIGFRACNSAGCSSTLAYRNLSVTAPAPVYTPPVYTPPVTVAPPTPAVVLSISPSSVERNSNSSPLTVTYTANFTPLYCLAFVGNIDGSLDNVGTISGPNSITHTWTFGAQQFSRDIKITCLESAGTQVSDTKRLNVY